MYRDRRATQPDYEGLSDLETQTIVNEALGSGATTLYTCPTNRRAKSGSGLVIVHNPTAGAITIDLHQVVSGGAAGVTNKMFPTKTVAVDETWVALTSDLWQVLMEGEALVANTGGAGLNLWGVMLEDHEAVHTYYGGFYADPDGTDRTLITVPGLRRFALKSIHAFNRDASTRTLTINVRESGDAAADANELVAVDVTTGAEYNLDAKSLPTLSAGGIVSARGSGTGLAVWANGTLF